MNLMSQQFSYIDIPSKKKELQMYNLVSSCFKQNFWVLVVAFSSAFVDSRPQPHTIGLTIT